MEGTKALVRSGRTRQPPMIYTPSKTENVTTKVDYALNTKKTLKKKLKATEREWNVRVENKSGNLVLEFTPAPYEVFKQNVKSFYKQSNENRIRVDENKNRVDESIPVFDGKGGRKRNQLFRVNLYNTTFRVTVNDKCLTLFTDNDLPKILKDLAQTPNFVVLNRKIAEACRLNIQSLSLNHNVCIKTPDIDDSHCLEASSTPSSSKQHVKAGELSSKPPMILENNMADNDNNEENRVDTCSGCDSDISINIHKHVMCNESDMLYHTECITSSRCTKGEFDSYICDFCSDNLLYNNTSGLDRLNENESTELEVSSTFVDQAYSRINSFDKGAQSIQTKDHSFLDKTMPKIDEACCTGINLTETSMLSVSNGNTQLVDDPFQAEDLVQDTQTVDLDTSLTLVKSHLQHTTVDKTVELCLDSSAAQTNSDALPVRSL